MGTQGAPGGTQGPWALKLILIGTWAQMGPMGPRDPGGPPGALYLKMTLAPQGACVEGAKRLNAKNDDSCTFFKDFMVP